MAYKIIEQRRGMSGLGDLLSDAKSVVYVSLVNQLSGPYSVTGPPPDYVPLSVHGVERATWNSRIIPMITWISAHAGNVDPGSPGQQALLAIMDAHALDGRGSSQGKRVIPYDRLADQNPPYVSTTTAIAQAMVDMAANLMRQYDSMLHASIVSLFHSTYPGIAAIPSDDIEWGYNHVKSGGWTIAQLGQHWKAEATKFKQITDAVPWYTNQDDMYAVWKSKAWDIQQAIAAIIAAHPQPSTSGGNGGSGGGGGGAGAGTGLTTAGMNLDFLKSPWVWAAFAAAGGLYYWLSVKKEQLTTIPYIGPYIGRAQRAVGMKKKGRR